MKTMYRFYWKPNKELLESSRDLSLEDKYPLYAITTDKKLASQFKEQRDMNKFIEFKSKMTKDEIVQFMNSHSGCNLKYFKYLHFTNRYPNEKRDKEAKQVPVLSTWNEKETVQAMLDDQYGECEGPIYSVFPYIFTEKYIQALRKLEYVSFWKLFGRPEIYRDFIPEDEQDDMDYSAPDVSYDELLTFINMFGNLLKE